MKMPWKIVIFRNASLWALAGVFCFLGCDKSFYPRVLDLEKIGRGFEVKIASPLDNQDVLTDNSVDMEGSARDVEGILRVEVSINGGQRIRATGAEYWKIEDLPLSNGQNTLCAHAYNVLGMQTEDCVFVHKTFYRLEDYPVAAFVGGCVGYNHLGRDKIYCMGGGNNPNFVVFNTLYAYDLQSGIWERLADMPEPRIAFGIAVHEGRIYVAGGCRNIAMLYAAEYSPNEMVYDIALDHWSLLPGLSQPRVWPMAGVADGKLYAAGGHIVNFPLGIPLEALTAVEALDLGDPGAGWSSAGIAQLNAPRTGFAALAEGSSFYALGGAYFNADGSMVFLDSLEKFSPSGAHWEVLPAMHLPRWDADLSPLFTPT